LDAATEKALVAKVRAHNEEVQEGRKTSLRTLKAVYRRGAGAFSVSHRPGMTRGQWAMGRVNAFLKMLRSGRPDAPTYTGDNDLLPSGHPWRKKGTKMLDGKDRVDGVTAPTRQQAARVARMIGCRGAHQHADGTWMPCSTHEEMLFATERRQTRKRFERLRERRIRGIETLPGGGLVSAPVAVKSGLHLSVDDALLVLVRETNRDAVHPWQRTSLSAVKSVYFREVLARDHGQTSAINRVHNFLHLVATGESEEDYVADNDLLIDGHPWRENAAALREQNFDLKRLGAGKRRVRRFVRQGIGRGAVRRGAGVAFNQNAYDGNGDGTVQDGTLWERPARAIRKARTAVRRRVLKRRGEAPTDFKTMIEKLQDPDGGFSVRVARMTDVETGWAVARKGMALKMPVSAFVDEDGKATEMGKRRLLAYVLMLEDQFFDEPPDGRRVVLGAWHEPYDEKTGEGGMIHLDVTDVYPKKKMTREQAFALGGVQDQKSVADLDAIAKGDWDNAIVDTGGTGTPGFDESALTPYLKELEEEFGPV
jgi:hypothetical protein